MAEAQSYFDISCPTGGDFYVCEGATSEFVGCCLSDPCSDGSGLCPQDDVRPTTFNPDKYDELPGQDCTNSNRTSNWYTCTSTYPPFMGCCVINPCAHGSLPGAEPCPLEDLRAANLSSLDVNRRKLLSPDGAKSTTSSSTTTTTTSSSTTTSTTNTPSTSASPPPNDGNSQALSTGAIIGISVAAVVVLLVAVAYFMFRCGYIARRKKEQKAGGAVGPHMSPYHDSFNTPIGSSYNDRSWPKDGATPPMGQISYPGAPGSDRYTLYSDHTRGHHRGHSSATYVPRGLGVHMSPQELDPTPAPPAELDASHSHVATYDGWDRSPSIASRGGYEYGPSPMTIHMPATDSNLDVSPPIGSSPGLGEPGASPRSM